MKKNFIILSACVFLCACNMDHARLASAGMDAMRGATLSDEEVKDMSRQFRAQEDARANVAPANSPYTQRLDRVMAAYKSVNGIPLNYKVYMTPEVNANATADGSVRVYSGLMDKMDDDELRFVLGHEIGHVALKHSLSQMRMAYTASAARKAAGAVSPGVAAITDSRLGAIGEQFLNAQYSQKQELEADEEGMKFLKANGYNPQAALSSMSKLGSGGGGFFSTHPSSGRRMSKLRELAGGGLAPRDAK